MLRALRKFKQSFQGKLFFAYVLVAMTTTPFLPRITFAQTFEDSAAAGQTAGEDALNSFSLPSVTGSTIEFQYQGGASGTVDSADIFVDVGSGGDPAELDALMNDDAEIQSATADAATALDAENSTLGNAFQTVMGSLSSRSHPDVTNDPIWLRTESVLTGVDPVIESVFTGCTTTYEDVDGDSAHVPDLRKCTQLRELTGTCNVIHDLDVQFIRRVDGEGLIEPCRGAFGFPIPGCLDIWVGRVGNNYWRGTCAVFENSMEIQVDAPGIITSAIVEQVTYDDYMIIELNGQEVFRGPGDDIRPASAGDFPPIDCVGSCPCELSTSWNYNPATYGNVIDVTPSFQLAGPLHFTIRTSVAGGGEGFARIRAYYDPQAVMPSGGSWEPPECIETVQAIEDGFCTGSYSCVDGPNVLGCLTIEDGLTICENDPFWDFIEPSPIPGISRMCRNVEVQASCDWWDHPPGCFIAPCATDPDTGEEVCPQDSTPQGDGTALACPTNDGSSTCAALANDQSCAFVSSECVADSQGTSGICYAFRDTYDCGYDVTLPGGVTSTVDCAGPVRCMGNDCVNREPESNPHFGHAAATGEMLNFALMDSNCVGDIHSGVVCEVFKGEAYDCKVAIGGASDCCETPNGLSPGQYIKLAKSMWELEHRTGALEHLATNAIDTVGSWDVVQNVTSSTTWQEITEPFVSAYESLAGGAQDASFDLLADYSIEEIKQAAVQQIAEWTASTFGEGAATSLFATDATTGEFTGELSSGASTTLTYIYYAYLAYVIINLIIDIVYACEPHEFEAMAKKAQGACIEIGSWCASSCLGGCCEEKTGFCCFNSPLARIIMNQVRDYSVMDPENPDCSGLTLDQLAVLDWDTIDLSEWEALLAVSGILPDSNAAADQMWGVEGTTYNEFADFDAPNAVDRVREAYAPGGTTSDVDAARECVRQNMWGTPACP